MRRVVSNSTPIIALANVGRQNLLKDVYGEIVIPEAVRCEVLAKRDAAARFLLSCPTWVRTEAAPEPDEMSLMRARLHAGEVETIMLAKSTDADLVILDDNAAKKVAKHLGLSVTGTLGLLVRAKREGHLNDVSRVLDELECLGFYMSERVKRVVLMRAGEA